VSVTEPSDAVNAGIAKQTEGRRFTRKRKSPPSVSSLVGWFPLILLVYMSYEDGTVCSQSVYENSDVGLSSKRKNTKLLVIFIITPVSCKKQKTQ